MLELRIWCGQSLGTSAEIWVVWSTGVFDYIWWQPCQDTATVKTRDDKWLSKELGRLFRMFVPVYKRMRKSKGAISLLTVCWVKSKVYISYIMCAVITFTWSFLVLPCHSCSPGRWRASWGKRRPPAVALRPLGQESSPAYGRCSCFSSSALCECLQPDSAADTEQLMAARTQPTVTEL